MQMDMKDIPVYRHSAEYADEHGELEIYRESRKANMECRSCIESALHANYRDNSLDTKNIVGQLGPNFGLERLSYVIANTIRLKKHDGRISEANKAWTDSVPVAEDKTEWGDDRNLSFIIDRVNPGLLDLLADRVRKETEKETVRKPSILEKIHRPAADVAAGQRNIVSPDRETSL